MEEKNKHNSGLVSNQHRMNELLYISCCWQQLIYCSRSSTEAWGAPTSGTAATLLSPRRLRAWTRGTAPVDPDNDTEGAGARGDAAGVEFDDEDEEEGQLGRHRRRFGSGQLNPLGIGRPTLPSKYLKMQNHQKWEM